MTVSATLLEAARWRWIPLAVIYVAVVAVVIAKYARPFLEQRAGDVRAKSIPLSSNGSWGSEPRSASAANRRQR